MLHSISQTKNKTKSKKQREAARFIQQHVSTLYGTFWKGSPKPIICKEEYLAIWNQRPRKRFLPKITQKLIIEHANRQHLPTKEQRRVVYFYGAPTGKTLIYLDIDVDKAESKGTTKGAIECAEFLRDNYFSNLYYEPSDGGKGLAAYFIFDKGNLSPKDANAKLRELEKWLRVQCSEFDIERVEIKGTMPWIEWGQARGIIKEIHYGTLARIPVQLDRVDELKSTTQLDLEGIDTLLASRPAGVGREVGTVSVATLPHSPTPPKKSKQEGGRSNVGGLIKPSSRVVYVAKKLYRNHKMVASHNGTRVTRKHLIYFLTLLEFFHKNPKPDHSLPKIRFKNLWNSLHESGTFDCKWHENIDKACRDYLSSLGLLNWLENKWVAPRKFVNKNGEEIVIRGQCCRWCMGQKLNSMLTSYPLNC